MVVRGDGHRSRVQWRTYREWDGIRLKLGIDEYELCDRQGMASRSEWIKWKKSGRVLKRHVLAARALLLIQEGGAASERPHVNPFPFIKDAEDLRTQLAAKEEEAKDLGDQWSNEKARADKAEAERDAALADVDDLLEGKPIGSRDLSIANAALDLAERSLSIVKARELMEAQRAGDAEARADKAEAMLAAANTRAFDAEMALEAAKQAAGVRAWEASSREQRLCLLDLPKGFPLECLPRISAEDVAGLLDIAD